APSRAEDREPLTYMQQRMTEGVVRDVDIVAGSRTERTSETTQLASTEAVVNTWNDQIVTSVTAYNPVNGTAALTAALAGTPGSIVVLNGSLEIVDTVTIGENHTLLGGGAVLRVRGADTGVELHYVANGPAGRIFGDPPGLLNTYDTLILMRSGSVMGGLDLEKTQAGGLAKSATAYVLNADNVSIFNNTVKGSSGLRGHGIVADNSTNVRISGNTIETQGFSNTYGIVTGAGSDLVADGNTITTNHLQSGAIFIQGGTTQFSNNTVSTKGEVVSGQDGLYRDGSSGNTIKLPYSANLQCGQFGTASGTVSFTNAPDCIF
ncbi:right-handed parallel beta-helix repeat-containing protein, partial [Pararhizobium sp.]|uniref:right-handed parallel beta-helix repeat-containing protein n=1 Tax=Pararhizobium sp. TaxID=1977563 RepID=UPI0027202849